MKQYLLNILSILYPSILCLSLSSGVNAKEILNPGFQQLKSLVGEWRGKLPDGNFIDISYQEINGGAIEERYHSKDPMWWNMSSVYHLDVDKIIMSHYCSWGNHPRMTAHFYDDQTKQLEFSFIDISMNKPDNGYMSHLTYSFQDENNFTHLWVWNQGGKKTPLLLTLVRKNSATIGQ